VRSLVVGTKDRPRLAVFRSNKNISVQLIDDGAKKTIAQATNKELAAVKKKPIEVATELGKLIAKKALAQKIDSAVFDRRRYAYHGRVKAVAEGAREAGLKL
jgi:large subunit ribosomal protein L18